MSLWTQTKRLSRAWRRLAGGERDEPQVPVKFQRDPRRIVVGGGGIEMDNWIHTDIEELDLLDETTWRRVLRPGSVDAIFAEHVWEHLTPAEGVKAARCCHHYLRDGGYLRIAVPDGNHPDPEYLEWVRPNGSGPGAEDHKVLYDAEHLSSVLQAAGFEAQLLEHFDEEGNFHYSPWTPEDGLVRRSMRFDPRNKNGTRLAYTSLIVDARKRAA